jgi:hypothetical protein
MVIMIFYLTIQIKGNMTSNIVYDYPKSSADPYRCGDNLYSLSSQGTPTNMSVLNCTFPKYFDCFDSFQFGEQLEPQDNTGMQNLNPQVWKDKFAPDFVAIDCPDTPGCPKTQYASTDPRLISTEHSGQRLTFDRPPITSQTCLNTLLDDTRLDNYGQNYTNYGDIKEGQIMYYIDKSIASPYFNPNFPTTSKVTGSVYKDPMGALKPWYTRQPLTDDNPIGPERAKYQGCLSSIQDSLDHRQDLMSLQMRKQLQQSYAPRWFAFNQNHS